MPGTDARPKAQRLLTAGSVVAAVAIACATPAQADPFISNNTFHYVAGPSMYLWSNPSTATITTATVRTPNPDPNGTVSFLGGGPGNYMGPPGGALLYDSHSGDSVTLSGSFTPGPGIIWIYIDFSHYAANPGVNAGTWTKVAGAGTGYTGSAYFDAATVLPAMTLTGPRQTTPASTTAGATPAPIVQEVGNPTGQACSTINLPQVTPGAPQGGWQPSWSQWPNSGKGGSVCSRTLVFRNGAWSTSVGN